VSKVERKKKYRKPVTNKADDKKKTVFNCVDANVQRARKRSIKKEFDPQNFVLLSEINHDLICDVAVD